MSTETLELVHPARRPVTVAELYGGDRPGHAHRPWIALCMVASVDGATAIDGRSGGLGNATDRAVLLAMRAAADVVLVGAGTAARERYRPPSAPGLRIGVVTNRGSVDPDTDLFRSGAGFVVAPHSADIPAGLEVVRAGADQVDLAEAVARIATDAAHVRVISSEGGPQLNAALLDAGLVDEVAITTSPMLVGGASSRLVTAAGERVQRLTLAHLAVDAEQFVFARWVRATAA